MSDLGVNSNCCFSHAKALFSFQLLEAMYQDSGIPLKSIQVDGGMTANNLLMQLQADLMGIDVGM